MAYLGYALAELATVPYEVYRHAAAEGSASVAAVTTAFKGGALPSIGEPGYIPIVRSYPAYTGPATTAPATNLPGVTPRQTTYDLFKSILQAKAQQAYGTPGAPTFLQTEKGQKIMKFAIVALIAWLFLF